MPSPIEAWEDTRIQNYVAGLPTDALRRLAVGHPDAMEAALEEILPKPLLCGRSGPLI